MNLAFKEVFGDARPTLPLQDSGNIVCGNATRLDWEQVCPKEQGVEVYILGNPPYLGARMQNSEQKADLSRIFSGVNGHKNLDYIACWFMKGAEYIEGSTSQLAFVSTNSVSQGEQVALLWPHIFSKDLEISFAHQSFKWANNAKGNAGVICIVVGLRGKSNKRKFIYKNNTQTIASEINAYLKSAPNVFIYRRSKPISELPALVFGSMPNDGGHLILSKEERDDLISRNGESVKKFIKKYMGAQEFLKGIQRWCLWIEDDAIDEALAFEEIKKRIYAVKENRLNSRRSATNDLASVPYKFGHIAHKSGTALMVPSATSERRDYIPIGMFDESTVINNLAHAIYSVDSYIFCLLSARMHMVWIKAVAGRLKTDYRYSGAICYNNFPVPSLTEDQKCNLEEHVFKVLDEREAHSEKTMAELYDPDTMPEELRIAHHEMDLAVEQCYRARPFKTDEERLEYLFKLYEEMTAAESK
jgi:hypothetical protein